MHPLSTLSLAFVLMLTAACASGPRPGHEPPPPNAVTLDDAGIRAALVGKTLQTFSQRGEAVTQTFNADGTSAFTMGSERLVEHWRVADGQICIDSPRYPRECDVVKQAPEGLWFLDGKTGALQNHYQVVP
ncbi:hypothetical protein [Pseudomonas oryzihabitans]|uniref:Lipoprotein n=1 Tax=Pseudomonas oryzihabitans TaxID=47885 RepID=A0AAJ2BUV1_9PSED|nr:hypothetical protein [Pseudomonas psychrotolerans]MDR6233348.1 hypothetical protein [Pseudomonas psychrotolerans]MDR6357630.1 hypothetical protein [Pseudomonas psychrotolerans]